MASRRVDSVQSSIGKTSLMKMTLLLPNCVFLRYVHILGWNEVISLGLLLLGIEWEKCSQLFLSALLQNSFFLTPNKHYMLLVFQMQPEHLDRGLVLGNSKGFQLPAGFTETNRAHVLIVTYLIRYPISCT